MENMVQSPYSDEQISVWLKGLLTIAWADGHFDPQEQELIAELTATELAPTSEIGSMKPISPEDLAAGLGEDLQIAENFMRTAVMVAIADGTYSNPEDDVLHQFCVALGLQPKILESLRLTLNYRPDSTIAGVAQTEETHLAPLQPLQEWLDHLDVQDPRLARFLCKMIPPQCPFERDVKLFGNKVVHIPPMCKLNPLYDQLVGLRFRALSYLADECKEDVSKYC
ncbi:MAG: nitrogenase [Cyanobacteria bacterium RM1_2_2]|nr:nitrogenase [Cyanobacteria bacterium RM1_2_2]